MASYYGNTSHIYDLTKGNFITPYYHVKSSDKKRAQFILNSDMVDVEPEQLQMLCRALYKSVIKSAYEDGDYLYNATNVVVDWDREVRSISFAKLERVIGRASVMISLVGWQRDLVEKLKAKKETRAIYLFKSNNIDNVWVVTDDPKTELILEYSEIYMDFLDENKSVICDFLVFGENEIDTTSLPPSTKIIECGE